MSRRALAAAAGLTLLAFVLRVRGMGQSLFGDEVLTYQIIDHGSLVDVLRALRAAPESTPPLHYALAWAAGGISGALTDIRLPSLVAGSATVPLLLAVGRRLVPARAAWLAAAAFALSPFATLYATETRAYALVTAATTAALLLLLRALERSSTGRWAAFAAAGIVALYAHYTAVLVLGVAALWAWFARPDRRRPLLLAHAAVVVLYLPWRRPRCSSAWRSCSPPAARWRLSPRGSRSPPWRSGRSASRSPTRGARRPRRWPP